MGIDGKRKVLRPRPAPLLALFDIDGTLVRRAGSTHRDALVVAVRKALGVETRNDNIALHGKLDHDILMEMMAHAGVARRRAQAALPRICQIAERYYLRRVPDLRRKACPGVRRLLRRLRQRAAVVGLVSGNLSRIGWKKLARAGLRHCFDFGAFAEMAPTRIELAGLALAEAAERGWVHGKSAGVLIGDTPNDIEAGRAHGLHTIAVATGLCSMEELRECRPTLCVPDLSHPAVSEWFSTVLLKSR